MFEIYDGKVPIKMINGEVYDSKEAAGKVYPAFNAGTVVLQKDGENIYSVDSMRILRENYPATEGMSDEKALEYIWAEMHKPAPAPTPENTPMTQAEGQALGQQMTDLELMILEGTSNV